MGEHDKNTQPDTTPGDDPQGPPTEVTEAPPREDQADATETPSVEELHLLLEDARSKADAHWNELLRNRAEQDNLRKRSQRDVEQAHKFALEGFVRELLPVKDSLELGLSAAKEPDADIHKVIEGVELTLKIFASVLDKFHVEEVDPRDQPFDPERHQAMSMQPSDRHEPNTVITVYQKGYLLNGRLIRPAMVVVAAQP